MCVLWKEEEMTDLTDKWKKGELPSGYYYVKNEFGNIFPSDYSEDYDYISDTVIKDFFTEVSEIKDVLEKVPSYEEWKFAQEQLHKEGTWYTERAYKNVRKAVRELTKKLLQVKPELREWLEVNYGEYL